MTCRELTEFIIDRLEGDLGPAESAAFDAHLAECPDCVTYLRAYEETIRLGKAICREDHDAVADDVPEDLVQAILTARGKKT